MLPKEIYNVFDVIVAGDMLKRGKPYPDPYLHAAKELGLKSSDCLAIENAPYGIRSAKAAQMDCFVIATSLPKESLQKLIRFLTIIKNYMNILKTLIDRNCYQLRQKQILYSVFPKQLKNQCVLRALRLSVFLYSGRFYYP